MDVLFFIVLNLFRISSFGFRAFKFQRIRGSESFLRCIAHHRTIQQPVHPSFDIGYVIANRRLIAFEPGEERDVRDVGQRVGAGDKVSVTHLLIQCRQMLLHLFFGLFDLVVVRDITRGLLQARVGEVDPDARPRPLVGIFRHERYRGIFFLQIFIDDRRLVDHRVAIFQHGDFAVGIALEQLFGLILQVALDEIVWDVLFGQDNPCPVGVGSRLIGK